MTRPHPTRFEVASADDPELAAHLVALEATGAGWVNLDPVIAPEDEPPPPGPFAFLGGSTHHVPTATWVPGRRGADGAPVPATVGIHHATGPRAARRLAASGRPLPEGWRVTQDHPRRGLVATVPAGSDPVDVVNHLLQSAGALCGVPWSGRWTAAVHVART